MPDYRAENLLVQDKGLQRIYLSEQRFNLQKEYRDVINQFIEKYCILFNRIIPVPSGDASDEYFLNTQAALKRRRQDMYEALEGDRGNEYRIAIRESGYRFRYVELINKMLNSLDSLRGSDKEEFYALFNEMGMNWRDYRMTIHFGRPMKGWRSV